MPSQEFLTGPGLFPTMRPTPIARLPTELLARIITIGCEEFPGLGWGSKPSPRRLKEFAEVASRVCHEWHSLVHSDHHFWCTRLVIEERPRHVDEYHDITKDIAVFKDLLSNSRRSDIDIFLDFPRGSDRRVAECLMLHAFALLIPYSRQIRSLVICSTHPLRGMLAVLNSLKPLPTLAKLELSFVSAQLTDSPYDELRFYPDGSVLDLSSRSNCHEVMLSHWGFNGEVILPSHITDLVLYYVSIQWRYLASFLRTLPRLADMTLAYLTILDLPTPAHSGDRANLSALVVCLQHLQLLTVNNSDITSILVLLSFLHVPRLASLDLLIGPLNYSPPRNRETLHLSIPRLDTLRTLVLIHREKHWTGLHDQLIRAILPPHLDSATIFFTLEVIECNPLPNDFDSNALPVIADLSVHLHHSQPHWVALLSRWSPEILTLKPMRKIIQPTMFPAINQERLSLGRLHTLSMVLSADKDISNFLSRLEAPLLRVVKLRMRQNYRRRNPAPVNNFEATYLQVQELSLEFSAGEEGIWIETYLSLFPAITSLSFSIHLDDSVTVDAKVMLHHLEESFTTRQLSKLVVNVKWHRGPRVRAQEEARRGFFDPPREKN